MPRDISANFALAVGQRIGDNVLGCANPKQEKVALVTLAASELLICGVESIKDTKHTIDLIETVGKKKNILPYTTYNSLASFSHRKKGQPSLRMLCDRQVGPSLRMLYNRQVGHSSSLPALHYE